MFASKDALFAKSSGSYQISRSLRFRSSASAYLSRTASTPTSQNTWTLSWWMKIGKLGTSGDIFSAGTTSRLEITYSSTGSLNISDASTTFINTNNLLRDPSAWYHCVVKANGTGAALQVYVNGVLTSNSLTNNLTTSYWNASGVVHYIGALGGYSSTYFDGYLAEVNFIDGQALTPSSFGAFDTNGVWQPAKYTGSYGTNGFYLPFSDNSGTSSNLMLYSEQFNNAVWNNTSYPITVTADNTTAPNGTTTADLLTPTAASSRHIIYQAYSSVTAGNVTTLSVYAKASGTTYFMLGDAADTDWHIVTADLSAGTITNTYSATGTITAVGNGWYRITCTSTRASSANLSLFVGPSNSSTNSSPPTFNNTALTCYVWGAQAEVSSTAGYYRQTTSSTLTAVNNLGADQSNGASSWNFWTPNNISVTSGTTYDSMIDSPTNYADGTAYGRGNYPTLNPLSRLYNANFAASDGNLKAYASTADALAFTTMPFPKQIGKWYAECTIGAISGTAYVSVRDVISAGTDYSYTSTGSISGTTSGATYTVNDIIGVAYDWSAQTIAWYKNGSLQGTTPSVSQTLDLSFANYIPNTSTNYIWNFGQRPFTYTPPSGFSALNTQNLPTPTIANGAQYMAATTYTGNGGTNPVVISSSNSGNNPLGITFQPDFLWAKSRSLANSHVLVNSVVGATSFLNSNNTNAEGTSATVVASLDASGFTLGNNATINTNLSTNVAWQWNAGGTPTVDNSAGAGNVPTAGSVKINGANSTSTLAGSIAATRLSANTSAGFSVVTYTGNGTAGATVGHGLGVEPNMIICKKRSTTGNWIIYHISTGVNKYLYLNATDAAATATPTWAVNSSTITFSQSFTDYNANTATYVAYCFAPVAGYSSFGSYTGNGSADGPFVYCGFRPRFLLIKRTDTAADWVIVDTSRNTYNLVTQELYPDLSNAESASTNFDILSNGFKLRGFAGYVGASGGTYIYAAFAENPFKYSRAR